MNDLAFRLYILFTASWFLHLPDRFPALGLIRFDLLLVVIIGVLAALLPNRTIPDDPSSKTSRLFLVLVLYSVITVPFVEWPGSVLKHGLERFVKAGVFFYFTTRIIDTARQFKAFLDFFVLCQLFRVLEPLYLHYTEGYWGSGASMLGGEEFMERLSGSPHDVVNPNGLAFIILTVIAFVFFRGRTSRLYRVCSLGLIPLLGYELFLTGSRSGFLGLLVIAIGIVIYSRHRFSLSVLGLIIFFVLFSWLSSDQLDRFTSIYSSESKNYGTTQARIEGVFEDLKVALRRPLFGHGLGTSKEANANFGATYLVAHNLIAEVAQELGFLGLAIYLAFLWSIVQNFRRTKDTLDQSSQGPGYPRDMLLAMHVWLYMNVLFSLASYGLSSYEWYLFGGFSVVMRRIFTGLDAATEGDAETVSVVSQAG